MKKALIRTFWVAAMVLVSAIGVSAQSLAEAQTAYNNSLAKLTEDPAGAIELLNSCLDMCKAVGEEADDVKALAELNVAKAYVNLGKKFATEKNFDKAIETFGTAIQKGTQYKNDDVVKASKEALAQIHTQNGYNLYKAKDFEKAMPEVEKALGYNRNYGTAWLIKTYLVKESGDDTAFMKAVDDGLAACTASNDSRNIKTIQKLGRDYFLASGSKSVAGSKFEEAVAALEASLKYDDANKDTYYYYAVALNGVKQYDKAIEACNKGLALENGDAEKKARYYYSLGNALKGKGDKEGACAAFKNALFGPFEEGAKYEIEHELKCN